MNSATASTLAQLPVPAHKQSAIEAWLRDGNNIGPKVFDLELGYEIGKALKTDQRLIHSSIVRVVLRKSEPMPEGFIVHTAFPRYEEVHKHDKPQVINDEQSEYGLPWFFKVYFGADWYDGPDTLPVIEDYVQDQYNMHDPESKVLLEQLSQLIADQPSEAEVERLVHQTWLSDGDLVVGETWQNLLATLKAQLEQLSKTQPATKSSKLFGKLLKRG